jgi:3-deoxy-manno-octulosonate cytidylyltransferase (CMP-KDO synthetase)
MERQFQWMVDGQPVKMENILIVIPARYESHRLPGKVLEMIHGYPMIYWVYKRAIASKSGEVIVAADHPKVFTALANLGIPYVKTDYNCRNGTERVYEVSKKYRNIQYFINVQGDEPLINPNIISEIVASGFENNVFKTAISQLKSKINNPNEVKVALSLNNRIRFASRSLVPYTKNTVNKLYKIHGVYLYSRNVLEKFVNANPGPLEKLELVEQLRCIESDIPLIGIKTQHTERSVDTYEDLDYMRNQSINLFQNF